MVEMASAKFVCIVDDSKLVDGLGGSKLAMPVEITQFCHLYNLQRLQVGGWGWVGRREAGGSVLRGARVRPTRASPPPRPPKPAPTDSLSPQNLPEVAGCTAKLRMEGEGADAMPSHIARTLLWIHACLPLCLCLGLCRRRGHRTLGVAHHAPLPSSSRSTHPFHA